MMKASKGMALAAAVSVAGLACPLAAHAADYAHDTLTGNWGGARTSLHEQGIDLSLDYVGEYAHNLEGGRQKTGAYADQIAFGADFDFGRLWGWHGTSFHIDITQRGGTDALEQRAGMDNLVATQEIHGRGKVMRLTNFYLEQKLWNGFADVKIGRMAVDAGGFASLGCRFQNLVSCGALPGNVMVGGGGVQGNGWYTWPISQYGAILTLNPGDHWSVRGGLFSSNARNLDQDMHLKLATPGGWGHTLAIAQLDWHGTLGAGNLPGKAMIGGWYNSADFPDVTGDKAFLERHVDGFESSVHGSRSGFYLLARQQVTRDSHGGGLVLFGHFVTSDEDTTQIDRLLQLGLFYNAPFASRPDDRIGLLLSNEHVSDHYAKGIRAADSLRRAHALPGYPESIPDNEYTVELNYRARLWHGVYLMPDIQYIHNPGGLGSNDDITVFGTRLSLAF